FLKHAHILLRFNGIDTISDIYLNSELLGSTDNMFLTYEFDVQSKLKDNKNELKIIIKSPVKKALEEIKRYKVKLTTFRALPGVPYLRKAQYSFGWDWGPKLPDIGIWKSVELIGFDRIRILSIYPVQTFKYNKEPLQIVNHEEISSLQIESVNLKLNVEIDSRIESLSNLGYKLNVDLNDPDGKKFNYVSNLTEETQVIELDIQNPKLWWTHDLGNPNLYELSISILNKEIIDTIKMKIGIRDIQLIRSPDKWGETFYFLLNGVPIFAKGANWIPIDSFIPRGKKLGLYQKNLNHAKEANMNMIRVWGGGVYEDDLFYEICDKLGLLVWQDFPFACALYPLHRTFIENVKKEAIQNIKRIRHHPSLALWCGNNEIEQLFIGYIGLYKLFSLKKIKAFKRGYRAMFEKMLPSLIREYDPKHAYWPSSPSNGGGNRKRGLLKSNSPNMGDSHFWKVWHMGAPFKAYREFNSRFMSEYGFESFPCLKTIETFCPSDQYDFYSSIMENHQKNHAGNKKIMKYMKMRFSIPKKFEQQVILSQITQGEAIEYGIEHWRRNRNQYRCMGSLYWQLNDCWPVASWSSLDYYGRWKALHYIVKRAYEPFFANVKEERKKIELWIINDLRTSKKGLFEWKILTSDGNTLIKGLKNVKIPPCCSLLVDSIDLTTLNISKKDFLKNIIFYSLKTGNNKEEKISQGFRLFGNPKDFPIVDPDLFYEIETFYNNNSNEIIQYKISIKVKNVALYVFIESDIVDFIASDNFFSMQPGETRKILVKQITLRKSELDLKNLDPLKIFKVGSLYSLLK
ncbi:MAG: beta-mannosidase, partial [Promethearchaeota archaeon]